MQHRTVCLFFRHCRFPAVPRQRCGGDRLHHDCRPHRLCLLLYARCLCQRPFYRKDPAAFHRRLCRGGGSDSDGGSIQLLWNSLHERRRHHQRRSYADRGKEIPLCRRCDLRCTLCLRCDPRLAGSRHAPADPAGGRSAGRVSGRKKPFPDRRRILPVLAYGTDYIRHQPAPDLRCHQPVSGQCCLSVSGQQLAGQVAGHRPARPFRQHAAPVLPSAIHGRCHSQCAGRYRCHCSHSAAGRTHRRCHP